MPTHPPVPETQPQTQVDMLEAFANNDLKKKLKTAEEQLSLAEQVLSETQAELAAVKAELTAERDKTARFERRNTEVEHLMENWQDLAKEAIDNLGPLHHEQPRLLTEFESLKEQSIE